MGYFHKIAYSLFQYWIVFFISLKLLRLNGLFQPYTCNKANALFLVPSSTGIEGRALQLFGAMCSTIEPQPSKKIFSLQC